jgi:hypothetical protein
LDRLTKEASCGKESVIELKPLVSPKTSTVTVSQLDEQRRRTPAIAAHSSVHRAPVPSLPPPQMRMDLLLPAAARNRALMLLPPSAGLVVVAGVVKEDGES